MIASLGGNLLGTTAEALSSTAHLLTISLHNGTVWNAAVEREGSASHAALLGSLSTASSTRGRSPARGWSALLSENLARLSVRLLRGGRFAKDCGAPPLGCETVSIRIPQLAGYDATEDEELRLRIDGAAVYAPVQTVGGVGATAFAEPLLRIEVNWGGGLGGNIWGNIWDELGGNWGYR